MSKKVLAIYYTQSGQLTDIVENFTKPLSDSGFSVETVRFKPKDDYTFPWTSERFFDAMPESVLSKPVELAPFTLKESTYDLIVFAYQPWFLSPSIPATSLLENSEFKNVLRNTPVITLIGSRNMWINAQEKVKKALSDSDAKLVGNVTLVDRNQNHVSAVTILYWMLTGKKDNYMGIFPKPGVSDKDILDTKELGGIVADYLKANDFSDLQKSLVAADAVYVKPDLAFIENTGSKLFGIWANVIVKKKNRTFWLKIFKYYLLFALFIVAPFVVTLNKIFVRPFFGKKLAKKKEYYLGLN